MENFSVETIHYIVVVCATILGYLAHYLTVREKPLAQEHQVFSESLKAINDKLDSIIEKLAEQKVEVGVLRSDVENLKARVDKLEGWFGELLSETKYHYSRNNNEQ